jgi:hypothetical protein
LPNAQNDLKLNSCWKNLKKSFSRESAKLRISQLQSGAEIAKTIHTANEPPSMLDVCKNSIRIP